MLHYTQPHGTAILKEKCFVYAAANVMQNAGLLVAGNPVVAGAPINWGLPNAVDTIINNDSRRNGFKYCMGGGPMMLIKYLREVGLAPNPYTAMTATNVTDSNAGALNGFVGAGTGLAVGVHYKMGNNESNHWIFVDNVAGLPGGGFQFNFIDQQNPARALTLQKRTTAKLKNSVIYAVNTLNNVQDSTYKITTIMRIH